MDDRHTNTEATISASTEDSGSLHLKWIGCRNGWCLLGVLAGSLLVRLPFRASGIFHYDSFGYCMGGLGQFVAHSPGFVGFCTSGMVLNSFVHDINFGFVTISLTATLVGIGLCYPLARACELSPGAALAATAFYAVSVNTLYFSTVALSYAVEGMFATLMALCARQTIRTGSRGWAVAATLTWALGGAFRQTTTCFLFPLWVLTLWQGRQRHWTLLHVSVAAPIIFGWTFANQHFQEARNGFRKSASREFWDLQVMMPVGYDTGDLAVNDEREAHSDFHWPMVEIAAWLATKMGRPFSTTAGAPEPSLRHAVQLAGIQLGKTSFYALISAPALGLLFVLLVVRRRLLTLPTAANAQFFAVWIVPPLSFFLVGHFGSFGYLQVFLSGLIVLVTGCLFPRSAKSDEPPARTIAATLAVRAAALGLAAIGLLFYLVGQPTHGESTATKTLDVLLLQYTGAAIREKYAIARATINRSDPRQLPFVPPDCETDEQLLTIAEQIQWYPDAYYRLRPSR
jgi:hypothetical protein